MSNVKQLHMEAKKNSQRKRFLDHIFKTDSKKKFTNTTQILTEIDPKTTINHLMRMQIMYCNCHLEGFYRRLHWEIDEQDYQKLTCLQNEALKKTLEQEIQENTNLCEDVTKYILLPYLDYDCENKNQIDIYHNTTNYKMILKNYLDVIENS